MEQWKQNGDMMTRLAICVVIAVGLVYAAEKLCPGKHISLWEKYGPWLEQNKVQAVAILAAGLYCLSLAVWPEGKKPLGAPTEDDGFSPCE